MDKGAKTLKKRKTTPDLMSTLPKRDPSQPKPMRTANQIADSLEAEARKFQGIADILRGK